MITLASWLLVFFLTTLCVSTLIYQIVPSRHELQAVRRTADALLGHGDQKPGLFRIAQLPLSFIAPWIAGKGSSHYRDRKTLDLQRAGFEKSVTVDEVLAMKVFLPVALFLYLMLMKPLIGLSFLVIFIVVGFAFFYPDLMLKDRARYRSTMIIRELPFALDLLVLLVEAGLDFTAAVALTASKLRKGALHVEFDRMLKEFRLGASRVEALRNLSERVRIREVTTLTTALVQVSELGASIGPTLRQQAEIMRTQRFQEAERKGGAAAQKMLVPLVLFFLPAIILMIIAPLILNLWLGGTF